MLQFMKCARNYLKEIKPGRVSNMTQESWAFLVLSVSSAKLQMFKSLLSSILPTLGRQFDCEGLWGPGLASWELVVPQGITCCVLL